MTKLATLCKKFECSKDSFDENAEDLYPEDYQVKYNIIKLRIC